MISDKIAHALIGRRVTVHNDKYRGSSGIIAEIDQKQGLFRLTMEKTDEVEQFHYKDLRIRLEHFFDASEYIITQATTFHFDMKLGEQKEIDI